MRELVVSTFLTLDGVMQAPGGSTEDVEGEFRFGGWSVPYWDDEINAFMAEFMANPFDLVLGRRTYDLFASFWPDAPEEAGAKPLNDATKYVASRGTPPLPWGPAVLLEGDVASAIASLKEGDGPELQIHGSADLLQTVLRQGLIDRMRVLTYPVVLGSGKRLFGEGIASSALKLVSSSVSSSGVVLSVYEPAGDVVTGSFGVEQAAD
jgi:dihydrofolate reductase